MNYERAGVDSEGMRGAHGLLRAVDVRLSPGALGNCLHALVVPV
jgi:hypothetical protein